MARRPIIGITVDYNETQTQYVLPHAYAAAVEAAGGLPFLLPYRADVSLVPAYVDELDGMLFTGGADLDPAAWGETRHAEAGAIDPARERFERALMTEVEHRRLPALGVCLGSQLMNVHRGGSLNQFIPDLDLEPAIEHRRLGADWSVRHEVKLVPDASITKAIGKQLVHSNTSHKQSVRNLGRGLRIIATAPDGIVEGIEDPTMPLWVGVQWHPERQHDEPEQLAIFKLLVDRARGG